MAKSSKQVRYVSKAKLEVAEASGKTINVKSKLLAILSEIYANDNSVQQFKDTHGNVVNLKALRMIKRSSMLLLDLLCRMGNVQRSSWVFVTT